MTRTIAEREQMARERACPTCHAEAGDPCRTRTRHGPGPSLKGVHAERMALLPFELTWHRSRTGTYRAVDDRVTPNVIYQVGKGVVRYGYPWYVSCWREGEGDESTAQAKTGLSNQATAKRLAAHSRCGQCDRWLMLGDLEQWINGWRCRDHETCEAIMAERDRAEREQFEAIEREPWSDIALRPGRVVPELAFTRKANERHADTTVVKMTPADIDRAIEVLTAWRALNPPYDVDPTPAAPGPDWVWPDEPSV